MKLLKPEYLSYQGFFGLPGPRPQPGHRFGYGGHAMCYNPANDSLIIAGHEHYDLVAEVKVAETHLRLRDFFDPAPGSLHDYRKLYSLGELGGLEIVNGKLYSTWHHYYDVQEPEDIDVSPLAAEGWIGLRHIGPLIGMPYNQIATSGYLFTIPDDWCDYNNIPGQTLACGRGHGHNVKSPHGPALFAVNPEKPESASVILYRDESHAPGDWTPADKWTGGAWICAGEYEAVLFVGRKGIGHWWYGAADTPDRRPKWFEYNEAVFPDWMAAWKDAGYYDPYNKSKGYHTEGREVRLDAYRTDGLRVALNPGDFRPDPAWTHVLDVFEPNSSCRAMAYDGKGQRLFIFESWPPEDQERVYANEAPRIHVWKIEVPDETPAEPKPEPETVTVTVRANGKVYEGSIEEMDEPA